MSRYDTIAANSSAVVSDGPSGTGQWWQAQSLTSLPGVEPRTYSSLVNVFGLQTQIRESELFDEGKKVYKKFRVSSFRVSLNSNNGDISVPPLYIGDQVADPAGIFWQVLGQLSAGPGSVAYSIGYEIGLLAGPDRGGGL